MGTGPPAPAPDRNQQVRHLRIRLMAKKTKTEDVVVVENGAGEVQATVTVDREKAREMLLNLGLKTAAKADDAKLIARLKSLDDSDETADPGKHKKLYARVVAANADGVEITFGDSEPAEEAPAKKAKAAKAVKAPAKKAKAAKTEEAEEVVPAKKAKAAKKVPAKKAKGKKAEAVEDEDAPVKEKGPSRSRDNGIIATIQLILQKASAKKPVTKAQIVEKLNKAFPERKAESLANTVGSQVPHRIFRERGFKVKKNDDGYYAG